MDTKKPFNERVAESLIEQLKQGTAPWQKPWKAGDPEFMPTNPTTGKRYKGINAIYLMGQGYTDHRWMTYKQASSVDAQVRKGEKGTTIQHWKSSDEKPLLDDKGKPVLDGDGQPIKQIIALDRPKVFFATVFNAQQIDGLPELKLQAREEQSWNPLERAEKILQSSGAIIKHFEQDRAFYRVSTDSIHLPNKSQFPTAENYYATALHELGHWTGHSSRLDRDLANPFGSQGYAKEELRAEISSMILGAALGIGHDPSQHVAYVASWIKVLKEDPMEIFRAASDAEKIHDYVLSLEQKQIQEKPLEVLQAEPVIQLSSEPKNSVKEREYLAVPYEERMAAKAAGALWDNIAKSWFVGPKADMEKLERWALNQVSSHQALAITPKEEFSQALRSLGCVVDGSHPMMDGATHRISVQGDKKGALSGFYVGHLDGRPAGYIKNNKTSIEMKWKSKGYFLDSKQKAQMQAEVAMKLQAREMEQAKVQEQTSEYLIRQMANLYPAIKPTAYMKAKGIQPQIGAMTDREGQKTYIPATDANGKQWTMQYIQEDGTKRFAKGSRKEGCFHAVGGLGALHQAPALVISEGYATASSLSETLGFATVAAFDSGNLMSVAKALREKHPLKPIIIAGDDDKHLEVTQGVNPGRSKAEEAAKAVGGKVLLPIFAPSESKQYTDFNDLATKSLLGQESIHRQVHSIVNAVIEKHRATMDQQQKRHQAEEPIQKRGQERSRRVAKMR